MRIRSGLVLCLLLPLSGCDRVEALSRDALAKLDAATNPKNKKAEEATATPAASPASEAPPPAPPVPAPAPAPVPTKKAPPPAARPAPAPTPAKPTPLAPPPKAPAPKPPAPRPPEPAPVVLVTDLKLPGGEPVPFPAVKSLIGKRVWATSCQSLGRTGGDEVWIYTGEPLTLVAAEPFNSPGEPLDYNYVVVKNAKGQQGEVQLLHLSRAALQVNLLAPGKHEELLAAAFREGLHAAVALHLLREKHRYDPPFEGAEGHLRRSLEPAVEEANQLLHGLVYGTTSSTNDVMRNGRTRWTALADDERILAAWAGGLEDDAQVRRLRAYEGVLDDLEAVDDAGFEIARVEQEKKDKLWLRDLEGLPKSKVAKLDEKELAERDARIAELRERMAKTMERLSKEAAELLAGPPK